EKQRYPDRAHKIPIPADCLAEGLTLNQFHVDRCWIPRSEEHGAQGRDAPDNMNRMNGGQYVKETRIGVALNVQSASRQDHPRQYLRRDESRSKNSGRQEPFFGL